MTFNEFTEAVIALEATGIAHKSQFYLLIPEDTGRELSRFPEFKPFFDPFRTSLVAPTKFRDFVIRYERGALREIQLRNKLVYHFGESLSLEFLEELGLDWYNPETVFVVEEKANAHKIRKHLEDRIIHLTAFYTTITYEHLLIGGSRKENTIVLLYED